MPKTASEKEEEYSTVKVPKGLIEEIDKMMDRYGFRSRSEFVKDAVRNLLRQYNIVPEKPRFVHFNVYEDHVSIIDNEQPEGKSWVDVYLQNGKAWCDLCEKHDCDHTRFALGLPKVVDALTAKGWAVEDGKVVRGPL